MHVPLESKSFMLVLAAIEDGYKPVARGKWKFSDLPVFRKVPECFETWANLEVACSRKCVL